MVRVMWSSMEVLTNLPILTSMRTPDLRGWLGAAPKDKEDIFNKVNDEVKEWEEVQFA